MYGKLTAIFRYWLRYEQNSKQVLLLFGLVDSVTVNSILEIPTIKVLKIVFDFDTSTLVYLLYYFLKIFYYMYENSGFGRAIARQIVFSLYDKAHFDIAII